MLGGVFYHEEVPAVAAQSAVSKLGVISAAGSGQKVLVFSPHPDDESIAVGGYIAQSIKNGASVSIVLVTDGDAQHEESIRYAEFKKLPVSSAWLKPTSFSLGFPMVN